MARQQQHTVIDQLDPGYLARGASLGLTVLVLGGLSVPLVGNLVPALGLVWLIVVTVGAFAAAGTRIGEAANPVLQGAAAAFASFLLVLPLLVIVGEFDVVRTAWTLLVAGAVGALSGFITARMHSRDT